MATSAAEIAGYRGDLATGLGSSAGADASPIYGETDSTGIQTAADTIFLHTFQKNKAAYDKKVADQEKLRTLLQSEQMNIGRLLPNDRDYINKNYRDKIHDLLIKNPDITSNNAKYQELQGLLDGFREAKAYGGVRLANIGTLDADIAKETDPEKRARMQAHREKVYGQSIYDDPKPYQQLLDYDPKQIFTEPPPLTSTTEALDAASNSIVTSSKSVTPLKDFTIDTYNKYLDSNNTTTKNMMDEFANSFRSMPQALQNEKVQQWNDKIKQANDDNGYKPGDLYYVKPIQADAVNGQLVVTATTPELVRAQAILLNYKKLDTSTSKVSDVPGKIAKDMAEAQKNLQEAKLLIPAQASKAYADAAKMRADAGKTKQETKDLADAKKTAEGAGSYAIDQTLQTFNPKSYRGLAQTDGQTMNFTDASGKQMNIPTPIRGIKGTIVAMEDEHGKTVSGLGDQQMNALGLRFKAGGGAGRAGGTTVVKPQTVIYNTDDPNSPYFVARYEWTPKDASGADLPKVVQTRIIRPAEYLTGAIKNIIGEDAAGKENEVYTHAMTEWEKRAGNTNINGSIFKELDKDRYQPTNQTSLQGLADKAFK